MKKVFLLLFICFLVGLSSCGSDTNHEENVKVIINEVPFQTEKYLRIPYTLQMWEYEKEGLVLEQIVIMDYNTNAELMKIEKADLPKIYKEPLPKNSFFTVDTISHYYLSIQLPIPLGQSPPSKIYHRFTFNDTVQNKTVTVEGAAFSPQLTETPLEISSPLKDKNMMFINQSTMAYHYNTLFFVGGNIFSGERFAFDSLKMSDDYSGYFNGDPKINESYFNYRDTLYAVADGTVVRIRDGRPENNGDAHNVPLNSVDEYGGNYLVLDIGGGHYAFYAHCVPNSFRVKEGDTVKEGQPIALLGNSGNSDAPHLHFEITDGPDILFSNGVPFVLKWYMKNGETASGPTVPKVVTNSMMEETTVIGFE